MISLQGSGILTCLDLRVRRIGPPILPVADLSPFFLQDDSHHPRISNSWHS
jgi:hypothetical protein